LTCQQHSRSSDINQIIAPKSQTVCSL